MTYNEYRAAYDDLFKATLSYRLKLITVHVVNGQVRYTAVFQPADGAEYQVYGWSGNAYQDKYDTLYAQGWRVSHLAVYPDAGQPRYTAVFRPGSQDEVQVRDVTYTEYRLKYDQLFTAAASYRLKLLTIHTLNGQIRYSAIFQPGNQSELQVYGWAYEDYRAKYDALWHHGWRIGMISPFAT